jgi:hypothetical protein
MIDMTITIPDWIFNSDFWLGFGVASVLWVVAVIVFVLTIGKALSNFNPFWR